VLVLRSRRDRHNWRARDEQVIVPARVIERPATFRVEELLQFLFVLLFVLLGVLVEGLGVIEWRVAGGRELGADGFAEGCQARVQVRLPAAR
jgi:hypothetical protein